MFDNLRQKSAEEAEFLTADEEEETVVAAPAARTVRRRGPALGLSPFQRFVLALMLFLNVSVLGCLALVVFEKVDLFQLATLFF